MQETWQRVFVVSPVRNWQIDPILRIGPQSTQIPSTCCFILRPMSIMTHGHLWAGTAQWLERRTRDREVADSNPCRSGGSSNWILMSCQPHRVTSGQSNSGHKQIHISKLFLHIYQPSLKSIYKTNHFVNIKPSYTNIRVSPFNITPVKRAHKARTCWYRRPFRLIYRYHDKEKYKKGMDTI